MTTGVQMCGLMLKVVPRGQSEGCSIQTDRLEPERRVWQKKCWYGYNLTVEPSVLASEPAVIDVQMRARC